jgi:4-hydroxy-tetrahydrodipicolinate synthase
MAADEPIAFVMSITPFDADENIDDLLFRQHLQRMVGAGLGVYLGSPGGGEGHALTREETRRVYEIGVEELKGKTLVYATGFEPRTARRLLETAEDAASAGIEAMQVYAPDPGHSMHPTDRELDRYFRDVLDQIDIPVFISTHEGVGYRTPISLLEKLVESYPHKIVGINAARVGPEYIVSLHAALGSKVRIYNAGVSWTMLNLALGGHGFLSSEANVAPRLSRSIVHHYHNGDLAKAMLAYTNLMRLTTIYLPLMRSTPRPTKTALKILGLPGGNLRRPYLFPDKAGQEEMARALRDLDIMALEAEAISEGR